MASKYEIILVYYPYTVYSVWDCRLWWWCIFIL